MSLSDTVDLKISEPHPTENITLHYVAVKKSTVKQLKVKCGCKDQKTWCVTRHRACFKVNVYCSIACHEGGRKNSEDSPDCSNVSTLATQTQKDLKNQVKEGDSTRK